MQGRPHKTMVCPGLPHPQMAGYDWRRAAVIGYALVAGALLLRLSIGLAMSRRLLRNSRATGQSTGGIPIRESDRVAAPVVLGIVRSAILLPADWRGWESAKLDAVLAHERSHILRRDPAVQLLSAIHRALLWHSPLSWFLDRRIVRVAEEASDDAAVAVTRDRASYAEMLLEFIQRGVRPAACQGVGMARYGRPEARIHRILDGAAVSRGLTRWRVAAIVALACPLAYLVAAAHPQATPPAPPAPPMAPAPPAPQSPVSPATPDAPAPPVPPSAEARTIRRYMIVSGNSTATRWDSNDASDRFDQDALRARFGQNFAWFRKGGNEYVVTDAGILAELQRANEPQNQVNRRQSDVNAHQDVVNSMQAKVNALQHEVNGLQQEVNRRQDIVDRIQSAVEKDVNDELIKKLQEAIKQLQASKTSASQDAVNRRQTQVNDEQRKVNDQQQIVNKLQHEVNDLERRVSAECNRRIDEILNSAVEQHKAQQLM